MLTGVFLTADAETSLLQITVPRRIETNTDGEVSETHVTYAIKIDQKIYTLHLEKQSFLDPHFLVYAYNESGTLYLDSSFIKGHCLYQGYAAEVPKSVVTLSTCSGLRGLLQLESVSYGLEPLESAAAYEHILYQIKKTKVDFSPLQENYPTAQVVDQSYQILVKSEKNSDIELLRRILKIQIIMDKALFDFMGSEIAIATEKVVHIIGVINTIFSQLKVTVRLISLEIWSDQNKILLSGDANEVLQRFVSWKEQFLFQRSHDMAYLLIYRKHLNYVGATYHGMACSPKFAAGIALYPQMMTLDAFSVVMAQLLGINLGLTYDDIYNCYCPGITCIMNPEAMLQLPQNIRELINKALFFTIVFDDVASNFILSTSGLHFISESQDILKSFIFELPFSDAPFLTLIRKRGTVYCFEGSCIDISKNSTKKYCDSVTNCSGHGVCNSKQNCHCDVGYSPPNCYPKPSSPGGSYNDGYWFLEEKGQNIPAKRHAASPKNGLLISFYIFLPLLILIAIIALKWNKIRFWNREETVSGGSLSEDSNINSNQSSN
ncbi:A disintegrin and metallopeptidase domain 3-like [Suricata suricatta]|nr:A disintegrin and metallopeptidase domain 3-like [Suricata suricatta]